LFQELTTLLGFRHNLVAAHTHTGNAKVERGNRLFLDMLRSVMSELRLQPKEWVDALPMIEHGINNTPSASLGGYAPNEVFLGSKRSDPLDGILVPERGNVQHVRREDFQEKFLELLKNFMEVRKAAQAQLFDVVSSEYARRRGVNDRYNRKHFRPELPLMDVGSYVLVASHLTHVPKLKSAWTGPMVVVEILHPLVFRVRNLIDGTLQEVHASRLRMYRNDFLNSERGLLEQAAFFNSGYEVESVVDYRKNGDSYEVLVHWFGFEPNDNTWEPAMDIWKAASNLVVKFVKLQPITQLLKRFCNFLRVDYVSL
jgi:hypothetical protein